MKNHASSGTRVSEDTPAPLDWANTSVSYPYLRSGVDSKTSVSANRRWWDADADSYHGTHGDLLGADSDDGDFVWCPEGLREDDVELLGDVAGKAVLEIGCGSASCSRWLTGHVAN